MERSHQAASDGVLKLSRRCENADSIGRIMEFSFCWKDCREFEWRDLIEWCIEIVPKV